MSKFTKALEKVQHERSAAGGVIEKRDPKSPTLKVPPLESMPKSPIPPFMRGVPRVKNASTDDRVVTMRFPKSMNSEQYRMMRTSLKSEFVKNNIKVIMLSSSIHSEGKTVTATNLAVSLAENKDTKVALIDADLRRGKVGQYLGFGNNRNGLSTLLKNEVTLKQAMVYNSMPNLAVMPRGPVPDSPSELVTSTKFIATIAELRNHFDYIVIDAPPIMSVADAGIMSRAADGILFVVQVGRTPKTVIMHSQQLLKSSGARLLGNILTNVEYQSADYKYYNYDSYAYYGEGEIKEGFRHRSEFELKKAGWNIKNLEERFNDWWDQKVLKKKKRKDR